MTTDAKQTSIPATSAARLRLSDATVRAVDAYVAESNAAAQAAEEAGKPHVSTIIMAEKAEFYRWLDATLGAIDALITERSEKAQQIAKHRPSLTL